MHKMIPSIGIPAAKALHHLEPNSFFKALDEVYATGASKSLANVEYPVQNSVSKPSRIFNLHFSAWKTEDGSIMGVMCSMVEVTNSPKAFQNLQASEQLFRQLADAVPQLVWMADAEGDVTYYNQRIALFSGASQNEAGEWAWTGMLHDEDVQATDNAWKMAVANGTFYEKAHRVLMADGSYRWHLSRGFPKLDQSGNVIRWFGTATDIHFQKDYEERLQESEERLRIAMEAAGMGTWDYHFESARIVPSPRFLEIFDFANDELFTIEIFFSLVHPDDREFVADMHQRMANSEKSGIDKYEIRYRIVTGAGLEQKWVKSNQKVFFDAHTGKSSRFIGTMLDITHEVKAEEKISYRQAMLEAQNDAIPDGIIMLNTSDEVLSYNKRCQEIWNVPQSLLNSKDGSKVLSYISNLIDRSMPVIRFAVTTEDRQSPVQELYHRDGRIFERHGNAVLREDGKRYGWAWYFREITASRKIEDDLRRQKQLYQHLLDGISDSFISFDFNWNVIYANEKVLQILHCTVDELVGKNHWVMFPALCGTKVEVVYRRVMEARVADQFEFQSTLSGSWLDVRVYPTPDGIAVFSTDISIRRRAEEQVQYQKQLLQTVTENTSQALFLMDTNQHCIYINQPGEQMTGFTKAELQGKQLHYYLHHSHPDGTFYPLEECPIDQALPTRIRMSGEETFVHKDGSFYPVYFTASPIIVNERPVGTVIEVRNTSQEKKAERALRKSEEKFRTAFANASIGMAITDRSGAFEQVNHAYLKITGYSESELLTMNLLDITHPEDRHLNQEVFDNIDNILEDSFIHEKRYIRKDGGIVWVRISGSLIRDERGHVTNQIGLSENITVKKLTEQKLLESEAQFRQLADLVPQLIWTADAAGDTDYTNQRWDDYTRRSGSYHDTNWSEIIHPSDKEHARKKWLEAVQLGITYQAEFRLKKMDESSYRWFLGKAIPVKSGEGKIYKWFGTCTDINDQKTMSEKMESLVRLRTEQLQQSNEDLLQFAHIASHDLKEPLRKIMTFSSRINDELHEGISPDVTRYLQKIGQAAQRMNRMIEGVLEYSVAGTEKLTVQTISLQKVIADVLDDLEAIIEKQKADVQVDDLPEVQGVPILLHQLFYNLVNNSLKFSEANVRPLISIRYSLAHGERFARELGPGIRGDYHMIALSDNGIGFPAQQASRIFNTFTRLNSKDRYEGTGLGLALCRKIVDRHKGFINATGVEGEGATFTIYLPVKQVQETL